MVEKQVVSGNSEVVTEFPLEDLPPAVKTDSKRESVESNIAQSKDAEVAVTPGKKAQTIS